MRFGYAYWGFLGDVKVENREIVSTPDGNAAYSWSILWEAQRRGWDTWLLQKDRDAEAYADLGGDLFASFAQSMRHQAYVNAGKAVLSDGRQSALDDIGDLDLVLVEWRWPIPGRNTEDDRGSQTWQPDLARQCEILERLFERTTKVVLWDLDHKLTEAEEMRWMPDAIIETSASPREQVWRRHRVDPPIVTSVLGDLPTLAAKPGRKLVYVGSRYERDDVIDRWIEPVSRVFPFEVEFYGNWTREPNLTECRQRWPNVLYNDRVSMLDFRRVYGTAVACPLLAKRSYLETGFVTPRVWEALMFGTIPVGLADHLCVDDYVNHVAQDADDMAALVEFLSQQSWAERHRLRMENIEKIGFMDVANFVDTLEKICR